MNSFLELGGVSNRATRGQRGTLARRLDLAGRNPHVTLRAAEASRSGFVGMKLTLAAVVTANPLSVVESAQANKDQVPYTDEFRKCSTPLQTGCKGRWSEWP